MDLCCFTVDRGRVRPFEEALMSWCIGVSLFCTEQFFVAMICVLFVVDN